MLFTADKCSLLRISKKFKLKFQYSIHGKTLKDVEHHPYLGLDLNQDLSFRQLTNQTVSKAQRNLNCQEETSVAARRHWKFQNAITIVFHIWINVYGTVE